MADLALPSYARALIYDVSASTGYPITLAHDPTLASACVIRPPQPGRERYEVAIGPSVGEHALHLLVSRVRLIRRFHETPPNERELLVTVVGRLLPPEEDEELRHKMDGLPASELDDISRFLYERTMSQLARMPMTARIERELYEEVPEHRATQRYYLAHQFQDLELDVDPKLASIVPRKVYAANAGIAVAIGEEAADIAGVEPGPRLRANPCAGTGRRLREFLREVEEPGYRGDRLVMDTWARELELTEWFRWRRLPT